MLLYVSIVGGLLVAISGFFALTADARIENQSIAHVEQQGAAAMDRITQTVRNADSITLPAPGSSAASLALAVPTVSLSPTIFNLAGTALQVKEGGATAVPLTSASVQMTSFTVRNLSRAGSPGTIQISFVLKRLNPQNRAEYDYQRTFTTTASVRP